MDRGTKRLAGFLGPCRLSWLLPVLFLLATHGWGWAQAFEASSYRIPGEIRWAQADDLDGDARKELIISATVRRGNTPERLLHVYGWSDRSGGIGMEKHRTWQVVPGAVFWAVGPAEGEGGRRHVYVLGPEGLYELVEVGSEGLAPRLRIEVPAFVAVGQPDDFLWLETFRDWDGDGSVEVLVPLAREARFLGLVQGEGWEEEDSVRLAPLCYYNNDRLFGRTVGAYAYLSVLFYPLLEPADLDGDGRLDLLALQDGKGFGYLRGENGRLGSNPFLWDLEIRTHEEKARRQATLTYRVADLNRDGLADVVVHKVGAAFVEWSAETAVFLGRPGTERPRTPDQTFPSSGLVSGVSLEDIDGDGYPDMTIWSIKMGLWPLIQILLRRVIHVDFRSYFAQWPGGFSEDKDSRRSFEFRIDMARQDFFRGIVPMTKADLDGNGFKDLVAEKKEGVLAVYLGRGRRGFASRPWCTLPAPGVNYVRAEDLDGDGSCDLYGYQVEKGFSVLHLWLQRRVGSPGREGAGPPS